MNWHDVIDERALEMDRVIARELRAGLERAQCWMSDIFTRAKRSAV